VTTARDTPPTAAERSERWLRRCRERVNAKPGGALEWDDAIGLLAEVDRLRLDVDVYREAAAACDRLTTIVDEECGLQPVQPPEATLTLLERHLFERRQEIERLTEERDKLRGALEEIRDGSVRSTWSATKLGDIARKALGR
jgi:hypothetical protein